MKDKTSEQYSLMKEGKSYSFDDFLFKKQEECSKTLIKINSLPFGNKKREKYLASLFSAYGDGNIVKANFNCNFGFNISIGNNCYFNHNVTILDSFEVNIGNNVFLAPNVCISAVTHPNEARGRKNLIIKKVVIEDDVWIGANTVILPGVVIHRGAVVGAQSLVKEDIPSSCVYAGIPAKFIKKIDN